MHSVLCMVFNHSRDELITGGTGGMKVTDKAYMYISVAKQSRRKKSVFISIHVGEVLWSRRAKRLSGNYVHLACYIVALLLLFFLVYFFCNPYMRLSGMHFLMFYKFIVLDIWRDWKRQAKSLGERFQTNGQLWFGVKVMRWNVLDLNPNRPVK